MTQRKGTHLISSEHELRDAFAKLHDTWDYPSLWVNPHGVCIDFGDVDDEGRPVSQILLPTVYKLTPPRNLALFKDKLLILPCIPEGPFVRNALKAHVAVADPNGAFYYRKGKINLADKGNPLRLFRLNQGAKDIFSGKSERIIRALLFNTSRQWNQKNLAEETNTSSALVNKVVKGLEDMQFINRLPNRKISIIHERELLDLWNERKSPCPAIIRYSVVGTDVSELTRLLLAWAEKNEIKLGLTQWIAAWQRASFTEPVVCSAYVSTIPELSDLSPSLVGRRVEQGGNLLLFCPEDIDVLRLRQVGHGFPLVSDAQIYVDLKGQGLRSDEALEQLIGIPDFCKNHEI